MHERPQAALFQALRELGYRIETPNDKLPALIYSAGPRAGNCKVSIEESSQFASGLMLCATIGRWQVDVTGDNAEESPYVAMTSKLIATFPKVGGTFQIEADASSGSYLLAASSQDLASSQMVNVSGGDERGFVFKAAYTPTVRILHWPTSDWQADEKARLWIFGILPKTESFQSLLDSAEQITVRSFKDAFLAENRSVGQTDSMLAELEHGTRTGQSIPGTISRRTDLGDTIMLAIVLAPLAETAWKFTDLGRLRLQECERVVALRTELTKCGAKVIESDDTLEAFPSSLHGAEIETYNDHRMAMCFAILGLKVPGIKIKNPSCVKKTFPNFFQKLAAAPPHGLGVKIRDAKTGRRLGVEELFAE